MAGAATPALASSNPGELAAYVRARAADGDGHGDRAAADYARALDAAPGNVVIAIRAYRAGLLTGDDALVTRARAILERADVEPGDTALLALADAVRGGNAATVQAAVTRVGAGPLDFVVPPLRAWTLAASDPKRALAQFDAMPRRDIAARYTAEARALLMLATGRRREGLIAVQALLAAEPDDRDLRLNAAQLLAADGAAAEAQQLLGDRPRASVGSRLTLPAKPIAAFGIARLYVRLGAELVEGETAPLAVVLARGALKLDPGYDPARLVLAQALAAEEAFPAALAAIDATGSQSLWFDDAQVERINLLQRAGRSAEALAAAAKLARAPDADVAAVRREADLLMANARFDDAASAYRRAIALAGDDAGWLLYLQAGSALDRAGRWREAKPLIEKSVALSPDQPIALNYLGYGALENGGDVMAARKLLERAAALRPGDDSILDSLAWSYVLGGDAPRAVPLLERAAAGSPNNGTISEHLGDAYWQVGRRFEARYAWAAAKLLASDNDMARIAAKIADGPAQR
ncbi:MULTISPECIES: tetratricopeptide repeat protein [Sphingomonas]|uniref:tetratricopeptide repeat protein n=1 Tax=Sphingomonas TaxID=13687 RepID=UPI000833F606|nr:tetratricopeptide repeat protein [Sphingomonas sp. CCH10-B3]